MKTTPRKPSSRPIPKRAVGPAAPHRTVLLAVTGMSPAILTETVWALAHEKPPVVPDDVIALTTVKGATDIREMLLKERADWGGLSPWQALRKSLLGQKAVASDRLQLSSPCIIELPDPSSGAKRPAEDLRTIADNTAAADAILEEVRRFAENPDTRIVASIAGGRKTMGALLYAAMSLLGRETDRVTHVLVSEPFENCREFFSPASRDKNWPLGMAPLCAHKRRGSNWPIFPLCRCATSSTGTFQGGRGVSALWWPRHRSA